MFGLHHSCGTAICRSRGCVFYGKMLEMIKKVTGVCTFTSSIISCAMLKTMLTATDSAHRCNRMSWRYTVIHRGMLLRRYFFGLQGTQWMQNSAKGASCHINAWRNITTDPIENNHLAVCDETSLVSPDDYLASDLFVPGARLMQYGLSDHNAAKHRWYYHLRGNYYSFDALQAYCFGINIKL